MYRRRLFYSSTTLATPPSISSSFRSTFCSSCVSYFCSFILSCNISVRINLFSPLVLFGRFVVRSFVSSCVGLFLPSFVSSFFYVLFHSLLCLFAHVLDCLFIRVLLSFLVCSFAASYNRSLFRAFALLFFVVFMKLVFVTRVFAYDFSRLLSVCFLRFYAFALFALFHF